MDQRAVVNNFYAFLQGCVTPLPFGNNGVHDDNTDSIKPSQVRGQSLPRMTYDNSGYTDQRPATGVQNTSTTGTCIQFKLLFMMSQLKYKIACEFYRTTLLISFKLGCSRTKTQGAIKSADSPVKATMPKS